jgi:glucosyl-3-phosphoglycerate phosphatase
MPVLYLVRHGETDWNAERRWQGQLDIPLNRRGVEQAHAAGVRLAQVGLTTLYSSDLERAFRTAEAIGAATGLRVLADAGLREVDVGSWSGVTLAEARESHPAEHARWLTGETPWSDGETYAQMGERVHEAVIRLLTPHGEDDRIAMVCHGGPIRSLVARTVGLEDDGRRALAHGPNGSISEIHVLPDRWVLASYNDAGHLMHVAPPRAVQTE